MDIGEGSQVKGKEVGWRGKKQDEEPRKGENGGVNTKGVSNIGRKLSEGREIGMKVKEVGLKGKEVGITGNTVRWKGRKWDEGEGSGVKGKEVEWRAKEGEEWLGEYKGSE